MTPEDEYAQNSYKNPDVVVNGRQWQADLWKIAGQLV